MWQLLVSLGILGVDYSYHRWISHPPIPPPPNLTINIPTTADGSPIPHVYGRARVDRPILVWTSPALALDNADHGSGQPYGYATTSLYVYAVDMAFVLGIGFGFDNHAVQGVWGAEVGDPPGFDYCQINRMWVGQAVAVVRHSTTLDGGGNEPGTHGGFLLANFEIEPQGDAALQLTGFIELLSGNPATQNLFNAGGFPLTHFADRLYLFPTTPTPTWYRNVITVCLFGIKDSASTTGTQGALMPSGQFTNAWLVGASGTIPSYAFEVSAYPGQSLTAPGLYLFQNPNALIGVDANPMDVLWDLLTGSFSKCRVPASALDTASFQACALTLFNEGNGFSRVWDSATTASDMISEIDRQVDGGLFEDPETGLIGYWLNRPDYDPTTLPNINPSNCIRIEGFTLGGQTDVPNVVRVTFRNRQTDYQQDFRTAAAQANSVNQGTYVVANVDMPGVCDPTNAQQLANRELTAQSRPLAKCSAYVSRDFLRTKIGDPLTLTWPEVGISGMVMRVANVDRGTLANGTIKLDLIQDYFYQWKRNPPVQLTGFGYHATESHT